MTDVFWGGALTSLISPFSKTRKPSKTHTDTNILERIYANIHFFAFFGMSWCVCCQSSSVQIEILNPKCFLLQAACFPRSPGWHDTEYDPNLLWFCVATQPWGLWCEIAFVVTQRERKWAGGGLCCSTLPIYSGWRRTLTPQPISNGFCESRANTQLGSKQTSVCLPLTCLYRYFSLAHASVFFLLS